VSCIHIYSLSKSKALVDSVYSNPIYCIITILGKPSPHVCHLQTYAWTMKLMHDFGLLYTELTSALDKAEYMHIRDMLLCSLADFYDSALTYKHWTVLIYFIDTLLYLQMYKYASVSTRKWQSICNLFSREPLCKVGLTVACEYHTLPLLVLLSCPCLVSFLNTSYLAIPSYQQPLSIQSLLPSSRHSCMSTIPL
jgi:hypothetical protein